MFLDRKFHPLREIQSRSHSPRRPQPHPVLYRQTNRTMPSETESISQKVELSREDRESSNDRRDAETGVTETVLDRELEIS